MNEAVMTFLIFYADLSNFSCQSDFAKWWWWNKKVEKTTAPLGLKRLTSDLLWNLLRLCMKFFTAKKSNFFMLSLHECQNQFLFSIADRYRICFYDQCWSSFHFKTNWFLAWNCHKKFLYITELNYLQSRRDKTGYNRKVWIFVMQLDYKKNATNVIHN